jgi:hypothetical protein
MMIPAGLHPDVYADSVLFPFLQKLEPRNGFEAIPHEIRRNLYGGWELFGVIVHQPSGIIEANAGGLPKYYRCES